MVTDHRRSFLQPPLDNVDLSDLQERQEAAHTFQIDLGFCHRTDQPESSLVYILHPESNQVDTVNVTATPSFTLHGDQHGQIFRSKDICGNSGENCPLVDFQFKGMHREVFVVNYGTHTAIDPMTVNAGGGSLFCKADATVPCADGTKTAGDKSKTLTSDALVDNYVLNVLFCSNRQDASPPKTTGSTSPATNDTPTAVSPGPNIAAIAGGAVGGVVFLILVIVLGAVLWRRRRRKAREHARIAEAAIYPKIFVSRPSADALGSMRSSGPSTPSESLKDKFWGSDLVELPQTPTSSSSSSTMQEKKPISTPPSAFRANIQEQPNPFGPHHDDLEGAVDPENHRTSILSAKRARLSDRVVQVEERSRMHSVSFAAGETPSFARDHS